MCLRKPTNEYFRRRRHMQEKYLREIRERFRLPVAVLPLFETEILGLDMVRRAAEALFPRSDDGILRRIGNDLRV